MVRLSPRARPILFVIAAVLALSGALGVVVHGLVERHRTPLDTARTLAEHGRYAEAETIYLALARHSVPSLPALVELMDNHRNLLLFAANHRLSPERPELLQAIAASETAIDSVLMSPGLAPDVALLAQFWNKVTRGEATPEDRAIVAAIAASDPPAPWSNHLLGREADDDERDSEAAEDFAREAGAFEGRRDDADAAFAEWVDTQDWARIGRALRNPRFARQVRASLRMKAAVARRDGLEMARWFFPAQYEDVTAGILLLVIASGVVWFAICAQIGLIGQRARFRIALYGAAFVLGVLSTYVTLALAIFEHALGFVETGQMVRDAIYFVVGVGLREELSKALLVLPLIPVVVRWGRRREALACGALVGLGFAVEENIGYFQMGLSTALARFLTANFLHVGTTGLVAVALDDHFRGRQNEPGELSRTLMLVILVHGLYDFFLSSNSVSGGSFLAMFVFVLLTRRFVDVLRELPGREGPLLRWFCIGLSVVAGASFVYACTIVAPQEAIFALLEGVLGLAIVTYVFVQEFSSI
jgi:RsiW-degrading membrane proteinase PrsW (M82 family)